MTQPTLPLFRMRFHMAFALLCLAVTACESTNTASTPSADSPSAASHENPPQEMAHDTSAFFEHRSATSKQTLIYTGVIEHMEWTMSAESWNAGGGDYYVLVRDDAPGPHRVFQREILRGTPDFPSDNFKPFVGRRVEVRGRPAELRRWKPDPLMPHPNTDDEGYVTSGGGLRVDEIRTLNTNPVPTPNPAVLPRRLPSTR